MRKKICFVVSSPITAKAFLINHIKALSVFYDVYLIANFENQSTDFFNNLPLKEIKNISIARDIHLFQDLKALLELRSYLKKIRGDE